MNVHLLLIQLSDVHLSRVPFFYILMMALVLLTVWIAYTVMRIYRIKQKEREPGPYAFSDSAALQSNMRAMQLSEKKLRRQALTQERLIASIAHDIKTPIKYLMMLASDMSWKEQQELHIETAKRNGRAIYDTSYRMYYLVDNLVQYMKIRIRNKIPVNEVFDLYELFENKIDIFGSIASSRNTHIINKVTPDTRLSCNYQALAIVLHNLLDNAVKHTRNGTIQVSASVDNGPSVITIEDAGPGLPPALIKWINNYQYSPVQEEELPDHGGIGLLIVLELMEQINGKLTAVNKQGRGAVINITLLPSA